MSETAVSDTGPLRHLVEIGFEKALTVFESVLVPTAVQEELDISGFWQRLSPALGSSLAVVTVPLAEADAETVLMGLIGYHLHPADVAVAALAGRHPTSLVLTDDLALRRAVESAGRTPMGSIGVLVRAYRRGMFDRATVDAALDALATGSTLYLSPGLRKRIPRLLDDGA